ncbi:MAG: arsenite methyltransferase [Spirochaetes bacterium]|nr:arsenite methyltransferase [Spirochaetota bacterium]
MNEPNPETIRGKVQEVCAKAAGGGQGSSCCGSTSCCGSNGSEADAIAQRLGYPQAELAALPQGANLGLGCGNPLAIASLKPGETVLDLGSGAGIDCFLAAARVGPSGKVIGVDMTPAMIAKARANAEKTGAAGVEFRLGEIERLPVADDSIDVVISNCVVNLSPEKPRVIADLFRVLKPGGRIALSDVVALRPEPADLRADLELHAACVSGAMEIGAWTRLLGERGFLEVAVRVQEGSREMIDGWADGRDLGGHFASASIEAVKPEGATRG